jgi:uncharacterized RDD family membrane protein YckC
MQPTKLAIIKPFAIAAGILYATSLVFNVTEYFIGSMGATNFITIISALLFQVALLVGVIVFFATNFKRDEFLKFCLSIQLLTLPVVLITFANIFNNNYLAEILNWRSYVLLAISFVQIIICPALLTLLCRRRAAKTQLYTQNGTQYAEFVPTSISFRVLHYFVDVILFTLFSLVNSFALLTFFSNNNFRSLQRASRFDSFDTYLMLMSISILIYTLFELVFKATPAKMLSNTIVVNQSANRMGVLQAFGRSFVRFIPFEPFSFLASNGSRGWHDTFTGSYVVDAVFPEDIEQEPMFDFEKPEFNDSSTTAGNTSTS